jgi:hypothetical protein
MVWAAVIAMVVTFSFFVFIHAFVHFRIRENVVTSIVYALVLAATWPIAFIILVKSKKKSAHI